jgi:hypothetical protein
VANSERGLHSVLTTLEGCRAALTDRAERETAQLLSVAILQLRMKLHHIADSELRDLCDAMMPGDAHAHRSEYPQPPEGQRQRRSGVLKLVK